MRAGKLGDSYTDSGVIHARNGGRETGEAQFGQVRPWTIPSFDQALCTGRWLVVSIRHSDVRFRGRCCPVGGGRGRVRHLTAYYIKLLPERCSLRFTLQGIPSLPRPDQKSVVAAFRPRIRWCESAQANHNQNGCSSQSRRQVNSRNARKEQQSRHLQGR